MHILRQPCKLHGSDGAATLLGNDDLGNVLLIRIRIVHFITIDEVYGIGILLDSTGFTQVGLYGASYEFPQCSSLYRYRLLCHSNSCIIKIAFRK